jgi:hypothetical protein
MCLEFKKWMCYIDGQKNKYSVIDSLYDSGKKCVLLYSFLLLFVSLTSGLDQHQDGSLL